MIVSYRALYERGVLQDRAAQAVEGLRECRLCPRACGVNRLDGGQGYCRTGRRARVASYNSHFGEEAPLVGRGGSGTIFFSSCNLLCSFCQNFEISHLNAGSEVEPRELGGMMLALARRGCHNVNTVTPSHVVPQILEGLLCAVEAGLDVPLVYNSGGYDTVETLRLLDGVVDIYMPDFKFWDSRWAERYCQAPDYRERAVETVKEMHRQVGDLQMDDRGVATRGLLVRHLVMPRGIAGTADVMRFLADEISPQTYVNVMAQYRPCGKAGQDEDIGRALRTDEYEAALDAARDAGLAQYDNS